MARKASYPNTPLGTARSHKDKQNGRLADFGHRVAWCRRGKTGYHGTCRRCGGQLECDEYGSHWWSVIGAPSLLKFPGVNIIRRCPGAR